MNKQTEELISALLPLAEIPLEDFGKIEPDRILMAWNGHQLRVEHVLAARVAIGRLAA